ncbi:hypothetical protein H8356DRAFT_1283154 [Neocallimastix lanati (nom. inval.)]|nr:hypothetical protein H8356DRAFT_1283154 [Neocallimastix sp. JGI-2020a]
MFYTTSISILKNKKQSTYETLFKEIKKNANKFRSNTLITTINFHCDFEQGELNELWGKKKQKIFSATDEIKILIENYKSKEINLFYNGCNRNELVKLWKDCLIDLNDININLK